MLVTFIDFSLTSVRFRYFFRITSLQQYGLYDLMVNDEMLSSNGDYSIETMYLCSNTSLKAPLVKLLKSCREKPL